MKGYVYLLVLQGVFGGWDTVWYHEWKQRLASRPSAFRELRLHSVRDFIYAVLFASLAWVEWNGTWTLLLGALLLAEVVITLLDFLEEDTTRTLPAGERVMHALMGIVYGAFLAFFIPEMCVWFVRPSRFTPTSFGMWSWLMTAMAIGVSASGVRDLVASSVLSKSDHTVMSSVT